MNKPIKFDLKVLAPIASRRTTSLLVNGSTYHFFPYWIKDIGNGEVELYGLDGLPQELRDAIGMMREVESRGIQMNSIKETTPDSYEGSKTNPFKMDEVGQLAQVCPTPNNCTHPNCRCLK